MERHSRPSLFAAATLYLLAAAGLWIASLYAADFVMLVQRMWPYLTLEWANLLVNLVYYGLFLALPLLIWLSEQSDAAYLRLNPISFSATLGSICAALLCVLLIYDGTVLWSMLWQKLGFDVFTDNYIRPADSGELMRSVLSGAVIAVICEELLFRGVILSAWEIRGRRRAVLATAILFAAIHGSLLGLPGEFLGGTVLALLVLWTNSLYAGMIFHSVYNAALIMLSYVASGMPVEEESYELAAIVGGISGIGMLLFEMAFIGLILIAVLHAIRRHAAPSPAISDRHPLSTGTTIVLMAGVVSALGLFVMDVLQRVGGAA